MYKEDLTLNNLQWLICHKNPIKLNHIYLIYMYKEDLALNNLQWLICHSFQPNQTKPNVNYLVNCNHFWRIHAVYYTGLELSSLCPKGQPKRHFWDSTTLSNSWLLPWIYRAKLSEQKYLKIRCSKYVHPGTKELIASHCLLIDMRFF